MSLSIGLLVFIIATIRQQISIYSTGPYRGLLNIFACLYPPHLEKWGYKFFFRSLRSRILFSTPHLKIRSAAPGIALPVMYVTVHYGEHDSAALFTCVSYAEARNRYRLEVRPSVRRVRSSHAGTVSKRLNILSCFLHHTIAHSF